MVKIKIPKSSRFKKLLTISLLQIVSIKKLHKFLVFHKGRLTGKNGIYMYIQINIYCVVILYVQFIGLYLILCETVYIVKLRHWGRMKDTHL